MEFVCNLKPTDDFTNRLSQQVEKIKQDEIFRKEYLDMTAHEADVRREGYSQGVAAGIQQGLNQGISEGAHDAKLETARKMLNKDIDIKMIMELTDLSESDILNLKPQAH